MLFRDHRLHFPLTVRMTCHTIGSTQLHAQLFRSLPAQAKPGVLHIWEWCQKIRVSLLRRSLIRVRPSAAEPATEPLPTTTNCCRIHPAPGALSAHHQRTGFGRARPEDSAGHPERLRRTAAERKAWRAERAPARSSERHALQRPAPATLYPGFPQLQRARNRRDENAVRDGQHQRLPVGSLPAVVAPFSGKGPGAVLSGQ